MVRSVKPAGRYGCPIELALEVLGGKWTTVLLAHLKERPRRYRELSRLVPTLSDKMLTQRLRDLRDQRLVEQEGDHYALSDRGRSLAPVLEALYAWGAAIAREDDLAIGAGAGRSYR
jgi:DNA-binding HxlR family transcriptional regulator